MTLDERARKIWLEIARLPDDRIEKMIAAELRAVVEEDRMSETCYTQLLSDLENHKLWLKKAKSEAYADAARIAEEGPPKGGVINVDGDVNDVSVIVKGWQNWTAKTIRARAAELK